MRSEEQINISSEYVKIPYEDLENWTSDQQENALLAFKKSCTVFLSLPPEKPILPQNLGGTAEDWQSPCQVAEGLKSPTNQEARLFFEQEFTILSFAEDKEGLFTGYFAPEYKGSHYPTEEYRYPLYGMPEDLKILDLGKFNLELQGKTIVGQIKDGDFVPYADRENIEKGALQDQKLELVWLKDPADAFFMHIQGSGVIRYENGEQKLFGYAGKNGKDYQAIGRFLVESGEISKENISMQAIRAWIEHNPIEAKRLMWKNPSYIFFKPRNGFLPVGSFNVELTEGRSLAVDPSYVPLGIPLWLDVRASSENSPPLQRLVVAQDTGGAIKGRVRADVYWGIGETAGHIAGHMKDKGQYYFLIPNILAQKILSEKLAEPLGGNNDS
ncbi:MAG: MltA domain-containing protein [Emcibacter sp.]|nr:MltA domain-containing protein [Emcibacter sp.]